MVLGEKVVSHVKELVPHISTTAGINKLSFVEKFGTAFRRKKSEHSELVKRFQEITRSNDQLINTLLALMVSATAEVSLALTNMIDLYLGSTHASDISALAASSDVGDKLNGYCHEALRIEPPFRGVYRTAKEKKEILGLTVEAGERIFLDIHAANTHEKTFQNPRQPDPCRDKKAAFYADGLHKSLGEALTTKIMSEVLRAVFSFKNVRRAPGNSGQLQRFKDGDHPQLRYSYLGPDQFPTAWPASLTIEYDV